MKNNKLVIAGILFSIVGLIIIVISFVMINFDFSKFAEIEGGKVKNYDILVKDISTIKLSTIEDDVIVIPSKDNKIHIKYHETNSKKYNISKNGTVLDMSRKKSYRLLHVNFFVPLVLENTVTVEIPANQLSKIEIETVSGKIKLDNISANKITTKTIAGFINIKNVKGEKVTVKNVTGNSSINEIDANLFSFKSLSGYLKASFIDYQENFNITVDQFTGTNNVEAQSNISSHKNIDLQSVTGNIKIEFK